jgi:hypothetical protein
MAPTLKFQIGDLATHNVYTDCHAGRVIEVLNGGKKVVLQYDEATLLNGCGSGEPDELQFSAGGFVGHTSGEQRWKCEPNPNGSRVTFTLRTRKDGSGVWKKVGHGTNSPGNSLIPGSHHYYDFNF